MELQQIFETTKEQRVEFTHQVIRTNTRAATKIKYFHGSGGGGLVTLFINTE